MEQILILPVYTFNREQLKYMIFIIFSFSISNISSVIINLDKIVSKTGWEKEWNIWVNSNFTFILALQSLACSLASRVLLSRLYKDLLYNTEHHTLDRVEQSFVLLKRNLFVFWPCTNRAQHSITLVCTNYNLLYKCISNSLSFPSWLWVSLSPTIMKYGMPIWFS